MAVWAALIAVYIVWGSTYLAISFAIKTIPPFVMAGLRFVVAGTILLVWRMAAGDPMPTGREWRAAAILGLFLLVGGNGGVVWSEQRVPSSVAALMVSTVPLWIIVLDAIRPGGQKPARPEVAGILIGFAGVALLVGPWQNGLGSAIDPMGAIVLTLGSLLWSIGSLYGRQAPVPRSALLGTGIEMLAGGAGLTILGALTGEFRQVNLPAISASSWWGLAYLIVFGSFIGFGAYTWLLKAAPLSLVSTYAYVNPLIAVSLGWLLGGEVITGRTLVAAAIIIGAVASIITYRSRPAPSAPPGLPESTE